MIGILVALACVPSPPPARAPTPEMEEMEAVDEYQDLPPPPPPPIWPAGELPADCCVLEVFWPEGGARIRLWPDGRLTQSYGDEEPSSLSPFDPRLSSRPADLQQFVKEQRATWSKVLRGTWEAPKLGPIQLPNGDTFAVQPMVFRTRTPSRVVALSVVADVKYGPSLGRLEAPWKEFARRVWAPSK